MNKRVKYSITILFWIAVVGLLIFLCIQDTVTREIILEFVEDFQRNPKSVWSNFPDFPTSFEEWMEFIRGICVILLIVIFQWWMLGRRWRIVRYLLVSIYAAVWLFGEYVSMSDSGGWGKLLVGYGCVWLGMSGVFLTGLACVIWHIRKFCKNRT